MSPRPVVDGGDVFLFHQNPEAVGGLLEDARALQNGAPAQVTLLVGAERGDSEDLWEQFATVFTGRRRTAIRRVLLVMEGAALEWGGRPAAAARMRDAWAVEVVAPAGRPLIVPGGHLFATETSDGRGEPGEPACWWRFAPGAAPIPLGLRHPEPRWQSALVWLAPDIAEGHLVEEIPAGLLIRRAGASAADTQGIRHSVPVDSNRLSVLVGTPGVPDVSAEALATLLAALPAPIRQSARLVPGAGVDLLPTARATADLLGAPIEVTTGLPVLMEGPVRAGREQVVVMTPEGDPAWQPYAESVVCVPAGGPGTPGPRLGRWRSPVDGLEREAEEGVLRFGEGWQLAVTRAGLWLGPPGTPRPPFWEQPVHPDVVAIELSGQHLDDTLWPVLDRLLVGLENASSLRAVIHVCGGSGAEGLRTLHRLAVRHGVAVTTRPAPAGEPAGAEAVVSGRTEAAVPLSAVPAGPAAGLPPPVVPAGTEAVMAAGTEAVVPSVPFAGAAAGHPGDSGRGDPGGAALSAAEIPTATAPTPGYALESAGVPALTPAAAPPARDGHSGVRPDAPARENGGAPEPVGAAPFAPSSPGAEPAAPPEAPAAAVSPPEAARPGADPAPDPTTAGPAGPAGPVRSRSAAAPGAVPPAAAPPRTVFPFAPTHRSTPADREALRRLVGPRWDQHAAALTRALSRLPALRVQAQQEDARADLIAVRSYLTAQEGQLGHRGVEQGIVTGDPAVLPFVACAASGLRRLPSHRGPAARSAGPDRRAVDGLLPGQELRRAGPMSAVVLDGATPSAETGLYLIWSVVGRRVRPLLDQPVAPDAPEEIVFGPGTRFRVLSVDEAGASRLVLLREIGPGIPPGRPGQALDSQDDAILLRLREAARTLGTDDRAGAGWPERCAGPLFPWSAAGAPA
ncbi:hypothetical protein [Streptomyces sp. NPDC001770]